MAIYQLLQKPEASTTRIQSTLHQLGQQFWYHTVIFFRATSRSTVQRKTRWGKRLRIRSAQNDNQVTGIEHTTQIVYNISSECLSPPKMTVLQKGLTFCPVPRFSTFQLDQENVRLKAHFSNLPINTPLTSHAVRSMFTLNTLNLRVRSSFQPPRTYHLVETYIDFVKKDIKKVLQSIEGGHIHVKHNITKDEHRALISLKNNELIIKPADKGGSIVVLDRSYYMDEIQTQLSDLDTYYPISSNPTFEIAREIKNLVAHYVELGSIDEKLGEFLVNHCPVIPVYYTLPKNT
ncbi:unnamed protein product [Ranitomeya imitator]|uniref:Uncharacterized protein n=1 Tax=Ranitomeya imitator TaxID=111125 RepID=A0ABN9MGE5_9NEOB|nr:unnamed protein product [Ranitomeya imitator]